jgi:hypothetical protein
LTALLPPSFAEYAGGSGEKQSFATRGTRYRARRSPGVAALCRSFACFKETMMASRLKTFAIVAALAAGTAGTAMAEYPCGPGYAVYGGVCQPIAAPGYSNPVSGAVSGEAAGAANGYATGGPVGAVVGGALGLATGTVAGTANAVSGATAPPRGCAWGYHWTNGYCFPNR